jgi:colicin import membrane protein
MAEQKESSVLFSLKELMNLEEERIKQEEEERKRREEAELQARLDAERRAREEEERRLKAEEERRRAEEQRAREEAARLEAIRQAEIEKARVEAENQARLEAMRRQQEHEKELEAVRRDKAKKRLTYIALGASFVLVAALVGGGIFVKGKIDEANALKTQLAALNADKEDTERKLREAKTDEEKAALQAKLEDLQSQIDKAKNNTSPAPTKTTTKVTGPAVPGNTAPKKPQCHMLDGTKVASCAPGDSLCTCD